jgi:hypothetical protein
MSSTPVSIMNGSFLAETVDPSFEEDLDLSAKPGASSASSQSGSTATANMRIMDASSRAPMQARGRVQA